MSRLVSGMKVKWIDLRERNFIPIDGIYHGVTESGKLIIETKGEFIFQLDKEHYEIHPTDEMNHVAEVN